MKFRSLVAIALALCVGLVLAWLFSDPGYVLIEWHGYRVQVLLLVAVLGLIATVLAVWVSYLLALAPWRLWRNRRARRIEAQLESGLLALALGRHERAERALAASATRGRSPLALYLLAARSAQSQGQDGDREVYLERARQIDPTTTLIVEADLCAMRDAPHDALARLRELPPSALRDAHVLRLYATVALACGDADWLGPHLRELRRRARLPVPVLEQIEGLLLDHGLNQADDEAALREAWRQRSTDARHAPPLIAALVRHCNRLQAPGLAEDVLLAELRSEWREAIVLAFGLLKGPGAERRLRKAEGWLAQWPESPALLLTLARLCMQQGLYGKAEDYYAAALGRLADADGFRDWAHLRLKVGGDAAPLLENALRVERGEVPDTVPKLDLVTPRAALPAPEVRGSHGMPLGLPGA